MIRSLFVLLLFASFQAVACESNADCDAGSRCTRQPGQMSGVCVSALNNRPDGQAPFDKLKGPAAKTCQSDVQCGFGSSCNKSSGQVFGICSGDTGRGSPAVGPH